MVGRTRLKGAQLFAFSYRNMVFYRLTYLSIFLLFLKLRFLFASKEIHEQRDTRANEEGACRLQNYSWET